MMNLNRYQRLAYENPFIEGQGPTHMPDLWFLHDEIVDQQAAKIGITVSVAAENRAHHDTDAVWEVSVSLWPTSMSERLSYPLDMPIELSKWTEAHKQIAAKVHATNVEGIGARPDTDNPHTQGTVWSGEYALHLRLPLNEEEREGLSVELR